MPGKVSNDDLVSYVFERTGVVDDSVLQGPAVGEDAAAIEWNGKTLVVSSDPISLAASKVGTLGVPIACNDVAASGGTPRWLTVVILLPPDMPAAIDSITHDIDVAARDVGVTIVGGHSEFVDALERPVLSITAMGPTDRFISTGGAEPDNSVILTKAAAIEGTAILATDFGEKLGIDQTVRERGEAFFDEISVSPDAAIVREFATAMHDPTEGGITAGLYEIARASDCRLEIDRNAIPIREETSILCEAANVDPLQIFGSGALLATIPRERVSACLQALESAGIAGSVIGSVTDGKPAVDGVRDDGPVVESVEDDLYPLWADEDA